MEIDRKIAENDHRHRQGHDSKAINFTVSASAPYVPSDEIRRKIAQTLPTASTRDLEGETKQLYREGSGDTHFAPIGFGNAFSFVQDFGECGSAGCGCSRLRYPDGRFRFRQMVVTRVSERLTRANKALEHGVRVVTIGSGALLTDFEILLGLWSRGLRIESIVAIDMAYGMDQAHFAEYHRALTALAIFFSPASVVAFGSAADYQEAVKRNPQLYGEANLFVYCDAAAVPHQIFQDTAAAALQPGFCAYELSNTNGGASHGRAPFNSPIVEHLPREMRPVTKAGYSMRVMRRAMEPDVAKLYDVDEPLIHDRDRGMPLTMRDRAEEHLQRNARKSETNDSRQQRAAAPAPRRLCSEAAIVRRAGRTAFT